jgi:hypothetical protein
VTVTIQRNELPLFGLQLFQSVFTSREHSHLLEGQVGFGGPVGKRAVINRRTSAFIPVAPSVDSEAQESLSLVAVASAHKAISSSHPLNDGDYIIEVGHTRPVYLFN